MHPARLFDSPGHFRRVSLLLFALVACRLPDTPGEHGHGAAVRDPLAVVAAAHGRAGPWAVAGYRMGEFALRRLDLPRGSFDLEVIHHTPRQVQYACIADGVSAATGASLGKLNLSLAEATVLETRTEFRQRSTGRSVTLRVTASFASRFLGVPSVQFIAAGRAILALPDPEVFEETPAPTGRPR